MQTAQEAHAPLGPVTSDPNTDTIDLLHLLRTLWRGRWVVAVLAFMGLGWSWYQAKFTAVPLYQATVQMAVEMPSMQQMGYGGGMFPFYYGMNNLTTEMEIIRSRDLVGRLVDELDLTSDPEFNPWLAQPHVPGWRDLRDGILFRITRIFGGEAAEEPPAPDVPQPAEVEPFDLPSPAEIRRNAVEIARGAITPATEEYSQIFTISATSRSPDRAVALANAMARIYRDDQITLKITANEEATIWLTARVAEMRIEFEEHQARINALRSQSALVSPEAMQALNTRAVEVTTQLQSAQLALSEAEARLAALEAVAGADIATRIATAADPQLQAMGPQAESGDVAALLRFDRRFDQITLQARGERDRARTGVAEQEAQSAGIAAQFEAQSADLLAIQQVEREAEATRILYETFLARLKETSAQIGVHEADSRILSEAISASRIYPQPLRAMAMATFLGLILGAGLVLGRELLQNGFRTADELERRTGLPVLGQIPRIPVRKRAGIVSFLIDRPTSAAVEAVRNLRTSVLLSDIDNPPQVVMSTSSIPGEGKTTQAVALAVNLAGLSKRVILIEGDIRRRTLGSYFGRDSTQVQDGLIAVTAGNATLDDVLIRDAKSGIDVLLGEKSPINAADFFSSEAFAALLVRLRESYDYIIIDTPPVLVVPDARVIARHADAVLYAVQWDKTSRGQVEEGLKQFRTGNTRVTGLVLSQIDPKGMRRYGHGKSYGAYSRHAKGYYDT